MRPLAHHTPNAAPPFEQAVLQGLSQRHKHIPSEWLYDDPLGLMARFNKNLLLRMQRELGATLDADAFRHAARLDTRQRRVELHLVSRCDQTVRVRGHHFTFLQGESILTALVHKTSALRLRSLAWQAGWQLRQFWADAQGQLALHVFESREALA